MTTRRKFETYKPIIYIEPHHYDFMLWMVNQPPNSPFLQWPDHTSTNRIIVDKDHGLDPFSAFYVDIHLKDRCSTKMPNTLQFLYNVNHGVDTITDSWAMEIAHGAATHAQLQKASDDEGWHPEIYNDVLYKLHHYYREC